MICISGAIPEINAESKDLKMQSVNSYQIPNNSTLGLAQVPHGPWRVTTGYHKLNQKVTAVTVPIASMVIFTGTNHWSPLHLVCIYVPIELVNVFFSILINEDRRRWPFSGRYNRNTPSVLPQSCSFSLQIFHNVICRDLLVSQKTSG